MSKIITLKQKLYKYINSCNSEEELKKFYDYFQLIKSDEDYDYGYFIDLIELKLKRMRDYFWTHNIVVNEHEIGDICNKLLNILHAGYKTDIIFDSDLKDIYVNIRNAKRFFTKQEFNFFINFKLDKYYLSAIREAKAKALFWKYLHHKIDILWD